MRKNFSMVGRMILIGLAALVTLCSGAWGALALWYQLPGGTLSRSAGASIWVVMLVALASIAIARRSWLPLGIYAALYVILLLWWISIPPSNNRDWADDVSRPLTGDISGSEVTLHRVRDFNWRSESDFDAHWETRSYDLDHLATADAVLSYWGSKAIAHAMISFGFEDERHVVFSVEIRRERGEEYSAIGGFFKQFETILIAADERDIIRVRTNVRGEDDYIYPLRMDAATRRGLFLAYVKAANALAAKPEFYNSLTSNCTTIVYRMAKHLAPDLPWDVRLLLTGYLPGYLHKIGALNPDQSVAEARRRGRITERARSSTPDVDFSKVIREGLQ